MQCMMRTWCMHEPYVLTNLGRILRIVRWHTHVSQLAKTSRSNGKRCYVPAEDSFQPNNPNISHNETQ
jgi:hypothetical protein